MPSHEAKKNRRKFLSDCGTLAAGAGVLATGLGTSPMIGEEPTVSTGWLRRSLKAHMIKLAGFGRNDGWTERFAAAREVGFEGVEPKTRFDLPVADVRAASDKTGLILEGTHGGYHWKTTHTNPDPKVRAEAQQLLEHSLKQTAELGCESLLLVPGHGKDGTPDEVRERAFAAIQKAIPVAEKLGVSILIENVWNHFLYDHDGGSDQSVQPLADFIDSFGSDTVGVQFDLGNHWKYGDVAEWVTTLGPRIKKLDIKGFSRSAGKFTDITASDMDWDSIRAALAGIGFTGWLAAEVGGGDTERLRGIAEEMETVLHTGKTLNEVRSDSAS